MGVGTGTGRLGKLWPLTGPRESLSRPAGVWVAREGGDHGTSIGMPLPTFPFWFWVERRSFCSLVFIPKKKRSNEINVSLNHLLQVYVYFI